jgi:pimeloyl-ACP methyl ester carboxylesterase
MREIVFLHGGGQGGWVWAETIAAIARQSGGAAHCIALDAPGCGAKREPATRDLTWDQVTADLVDDIAAAGLRDVLLVGHSQAGSHMPDMRRARPDLIGKLMFVSCITPDPGLTVNEMSGERIHGGQDTAAARARFDASIPMRERHRAMFCNDMVPEQAEDFLDKLGPDRWPRSCYAWTDWRYDDLAQVPVSYVLCLEDAILPLAWQVRFAERVHARWTPRIDAGHQVMNTRPQALAELVLIAAAG